MNDNQYSMLCNKQGELSPKRVMDTYDERMIVDYLFHTFDPLKLELIYNEFKLQLELQNYKV